MVHKFENDIFISYAHLDNNPLPFARRPQGWVSGFYETLKIFVAEYLGREPKIWVDKRLEGSDYFDAEIVEQIAKAKLLVSVLSPRYVESDWCIKELHEFCSCAEQNGCFRIGNKARVCKVIKYPVPLNKHPEELQGLLGYEFFKIHEDSEDTSEFRPEFGDEALQNFYLKTSDVAKEITKLIQTECDCSASVEEVIETTGEEVKESKLTSIYLAETTFDLQVERDKIRRELEDHGYTVLPEQPLPLNVPDFETKVREQLKSCRISIHLIGHRYGVVPEGAERSVVELQNELAAERGKEERAFSRLIWMPKGLPIPEQRQQEFIKSLQNDLELVQTPIEELKTMILDKLNLCQEPPKEPLTDKVQIYLICDQRDLEAIEPLYAYLEKQGFDVILPPFEGDEAQVRQGHQNNLQLCDAVIIYWGSVNELWLRTKLRDLQKIAGYGRAKQMFAQAIYVGAPETSQKQRFQTQQALLINNAEALLEDSLKPFLIQVIGK